jgi:hypothetical protein
MPTHATEMSLTEMSPTEMTGSAATATTATATTSSIARSTDMNLINEALSRARMRRPQNINSEARRSARLIAMQARQRQARELGHLVRY